jgi:acyl-CoA thioesterase-1
MYWFTNSKNSTEIMLQRILLVIALLLFTSCDSDYRYAPLPRASNVVILGDSLTFGTGAAEGEDYVTLLANKTGWNIINAGVPGDTSVDGLERLAEFLDAHLSGEQKIDLLIVELGGNDFLKRAPQAEVIKNLKSILSQAKANGIQTVLIAIPEFSPLGAAFGTLSDHPLYKKLAEDTNTPLLENVFTDVLSKNSLKADSIHPNAAGYRAVAKSIQQALIRLGFVAKD